MRLLELERELYRREAGRSLPVFLDYCNKDYRRQWFHTLVARKFQDLITGTLGKDRLMIFMPPQHGKSEIVSRKAPAWALGVNPKLKIVGASYSADLAQQFSRAIQRTIDSDEYSDVFPDTRLNGQNVTTDARKGWLRNVDIFETVGYGGFYKAVGVGGSLTGTPVDLGIIDDPIKDDLEANSVTYRNRVWSWYTSVFLTRLHNNSKQVLIQTRWHEDDLAGRLLQTEADKWEVVSIPAIKEDNDNPDDPRDIGEALWEEMHSLESLREAEARSPRRFSALYQQRPTIQGGNIVHRDWFRHCTTIEFKQRRLNEPMVFFVDTAYTNNADNDPTGIIATCYIDGDLYITSARKVLMAFPDLVRFLPQWCEANGYTYNSTIRIEPKANGISIIDQLRDQTNLNITRTPTPKDSKDTRLCACSPIVECGRVYLVDGDWNEQFIDEVCGFPSRAHDEYVDVLCYAIDYHVNTFVGAVNSDELEAYIY